MQILSVGIDLGKTTLHLVALGAAGKGGTPRPVRAADLFRSELNRSALFYGD
jgi:hypothetical protein